MPFSRQGLYEPLHAFCLFIPKDLFVAIVNFGKDLPDREVFVIEGQEYCPANFAKLSNQLHDLRAQFAFSQLDLRVV